ncbi:MAG TPA: hypothetical protein VNT33_13635, partial [Telluria sp.]|nr:hypothetical protein [Telluria sp.]
MKLTIRLQLLLSNLAAVSFVGVIAVTGYLAVGSLDGSMDAITANGAAIKEQLQADQMHDALRGDVLQALLAGTQGDKEAQAEVKRASG